MLSSLLLVVAVFVTLLITGGSAQSTNATCLSSFGWANNSLEQSPCLVSAYLEGACYTGDFLIPALPAGKHYNGPTLQNANQCVCSSVLYSVISACAACQNGTYDTWSGWTTNCSNVYLLVFPQNIPSGTAVPGWAYQNVTQGDGFNVAEAEQDAGAPESTGTTIPTGTIPSSTQPSSTATSTTSATSVTSVTSSASSSPSAATLSTKSSNTGAIAGGVVGGVVGLALISAFFFWYILRRHRSGPPPRPTPATYGPFDASEASAGPMSQRVFSPAPTMPTTISSQARLYDSSDPMPPSSPGATTDMYTTYSGYHGSLADHQTSPDVSSRIEDAPEI